MLAEGVRAFNISAREEDFSSKKQNKIVHHGDFARRVHWWRKSIPNDHNRGRTSSAGIAIATSTAAPVVSGLISTVNAPRARAVAASPAAG